MNTEDESPVVDDELLSSCAKDVKEKYVVQHKTRTKGLIASSLACSLIGVILGMGLRVSR